MKEVLLAGLGVLVLRSALDAQTLNIDHQPVGCAVAEKFPRLEARFAPAAGVAVARVVFQPENAQQWYAVAMKAEGSAFTGVLPKPKKSLKAFTYYIEVTDQALGTNRTADYTTNVVGSSGECKGKMMAATLASATVLLQAPAGAAALPAGFASTGVVAAGSGSAAAATGAAGGGGGGGLGTGAVVGIVAGAGAVAAGVVVAAGKSADTSYTGSFSGQLVVTGTGSNTCIYTRPFSGTMEITLKQSGGMATGQGQTTWTQTETGTGAPSCVPGPGGGNQTFGYACEVTGTASNLSCIFQNNFGAYTVTHSFSGALNGGVISGTVKHDQTGGSNGSVSVPITLR